MIMHDSVKEVALRLYTKTGNAEGHDIDNWLEAERIVWNIIEEETQCVLELRTQKLRIFGLVVTASRGAGCVTQAQTKLNGRHEK